MIAIKPVVPVKAVLAPKKQIVARRVAHIVRAEASSNDKAKTTESADSTVFYAGKNYTQAEVSIFDFNIFPGGDWARKSWAVPRPSLTRSAQALSFLDVWLLSLKLRPLKSTRTKFYNGRKPVVLFTPLSPSFSPA